MPPKTLTIVKEMGRRLLRLYNSFGDEHLYDADLYFAIEPHFKHPEGWLTAARARNAVSMNPTLMLELPDLPAARRPMSIRHQWEGALEAIEESGLSRFSLVGRYDSLLQAREDRKAYKQRRRADPSLAVRTPRTGC